MIIVLITSIFGAVLQLVRPQFLVFLATLTRLQREISRQISRQITRDSSGKREEKEDEHANATEEEEEEVGKALLPDQTALPPFPYFPTGRKGSPPRPDSPPASLPYR